ncbi:receptor tyrosine-protein kinase erbB-3-like [Ruditapes philippinarum]|uniref:receptor tyrosine-protein kinase erbB-3-like n=1 Tax=Ruditapes philippinarum TaxID=129788 RepID=UPI00295BF2A5|nr:receptor tyrosine-protein kinase erbB-3-like [Ruditapes philippinarum]
MVVIPKSSTYMTDVLILVTIAIFLAVGQTIEGNELFKGKVCYGTSNGFSLSGSQMFHYQRMRKRYTGCTFVHGNLEITHLERRKGMTFDLSFLETIEVVTGYVLILNNDVDVIPLTNLIHVRGESQFSYKGNNYVFSVILSDNRGGIQMPMLKEISGNVLLSHWSVCFTNSIAWDVLIQGTVTESSVEEPAGCLPCDDSCSTVDGVQRCWGPGPDLCQKVKRMECDWHCENGTCFEEGLMGCCHPECLGCNDGWIDTACEYCRHYSYQGHCIPNCPSETFSHMDRCIRFDEYYAAHENNFT